MWPFSLEFSHPHLLVSFSTAALTDFQTIPVDPGVVISILHRCKRSHRLKGDISFRNGLFIFSFNFFMGLLDLTSCNDFIIRFHDVLFLSFYAFVVVRSVVMLSCDVQLLCVLKFFFNSINSGTWAARKDIPFTFVRMFAGFMLVEKACGFQF